MKSKYISLTAVAFFFSFNCFAKNIQVEYFYSNNTQVIDVKKAFYRLIGKEQRTLKNKAIDVMQKSHIEQGRFRNVIGTYFMQDQHKSTADNSEIFYTSPFQELSEHKIFLVATRLANKLDQESVAVLIPSEDEGIVDIKVIFNSINPTIADTIELIHRKLPEPFWMAFSLKLKIQESDFDHTKVSSVEWIGSSLDISALESAFAKEQIFYKKGSAYLVFKNGKHQKL